MAKKEEDPEVLRLTVGFLRFFVHQTQEDFAEASGLNQNDISCYEWGKQKPLEKNLRRMAAASAPCGRAGRSSGSRASTPFNSAAEQFTRPASCSCSF